MDSMMFTFNSQQLKKAQEEEKKIETQDASLQRLARKRPRSFTASFRAQNSSNGGFLQKLDQNGQPQSCTLQNALGGKIKKSKIKNSSMQMQEKKRLRNIIDSMLGKNFENIPYQNQKINSLKDNTLTFNPNVGSFPEEGTKKVSRRKMIVEKSMNSKQNQFNFQNIDVKQQTHKFSTKNGKNIPRKIKVKQFQFANLKLNKNLSDEVRSSNRLSQRYQNQEEVIKGCQNNDSIYEFRKVNFSRDSIDSRVSGNSSGRKFRIRASGPKILYPESQTKLPSVFKMKNSNYRNNQSVRRRENRVSSAYILSNNQVREDPGHKQTHQKKQNQKSRFHRTIYRPKSVALQQTCKFKSIQSDSGENQIIQPKKLVFQNQNIVQEKLQKKFCLKNIKMRSIEYDRKCGISSRHKSFYARQPHRKLKELQKVKMQFQNKQQTKIQNDSEEIIEEITARKDLQNISFCQQSRETAQQSQTLRSSSNSRRSQLGSSIKMQAEQEA